MDRELLAELRDYFERLKHRADVRGGPDTSAMCIADEAIEKIIAALRTRPEAGEWIEFAKQQPDETGRYLVSIGPKGYVELSDWLEFHGKKLFRHAYVTHWQKIRGPQPQRDAEHK